MNTSKMFTALRTLITPTRQNMAGAIFAAAGAIAKKFLKEKLGIEAFSFVEQVGQIRTEIDYKTVTRESIESNIMRCPDSRAAESMIKLVEEIQAQGNSVGGV